MRWADGVRGARAMAPILVGVLPFAGVYGMTARSVGLSSVEAIAMSFVVFAGASQLVALSLFSDGAPVLSIVFSALIVNLRFVLYSASVGPILRKVSFVPRIFGTWTMTDQAYALTIAKQQDDESDIDLASYYFGAAIAGVLTWQAGTIAGAVLGVGVSPELRLEMAIPLTFLTLLINALNAGPAVAAAVSAGASALLLASLPYKLNLFLGSLIGVLVGVVMAKKKHR